MTGDPSVPRARRLQRPGWKDARLLVGLLLVALSVAGGARLVASLDETTPVYAAARHLVPGQEVRADDVVAVPVRLGDPAAHYVDATRPLQPGTHALRPVAPGELVPAAALGSAGRARDKAVTVPVDPAVAATLDVGTVVDVWVSHRDRDATGVAYEEPELLLEGAVVAAVPGDGRALGMGVGSSAVQVVVPADRVAAVIAGVDQEARVTLVPAPDAG
ncbi:MAG TPA: flagellar biosynthesis protein FlgA [Ornithinicoccus sp.]|nr:flagellar biosynthesis protein FlgA [Ornithinicoccus sp.]